jgi:hypothetical protein
MTYPQTYFGQNVSRATITEEVQRLSFIALKYPGEMKKIFCFFSI